MHTRRACWYLKRRVSLGQVVLPAGVQPGQECMVTCNFGNVQEVKVGALHPTLTSHGTFRFFTLPHQGFSDEFRNSISPFIHPSNKSTSGSSKDSGFRICWPENILSKISKWQKG